MIEERPGRPKPYLARVRAPNGRRVSRSFSKKSDAEAWVATQTTDLRRGDWIDPRAGDIPLSRWLDEIEVRKQLRLKPSTLANRDSLIRNHIHQSIGLYPLNRITPEALQRWVVELSATLAPSTVRHVYVIVTEALRLAVARGRLGRSPEVEIELPAVEQPEHRYLTVEEVWQLADTIDRRYRPVILLGAYGGLRPGETYSARWNDWQPPRLAVRGTKTKASRRTVKLPPFLVDELAQHRREYPHVTHIVHASTGHPVDGRMFRRRGFATAVKRSVGEPMRPHDLRHTHVALLIAQGWHPKAIADRLGHTSIRTTMDTYGHLFEQVADELVDRLGDHQVTTGDEETPPSMGRG